MGYLAGTSASMKTKMHYEIDSPQFHHLTRMRTKPNPSSKITQGKQAFDITGKILDATTLAVTAVGLIPGLEPFAAAAGTFLTITKAIVKFFGGKVNDKYNEELAAEQAQAQRDAQLEQSRAAHINSLARDYEYGQRDLHAQPSSAIGGYSHSV